MKIFRRILVPHDFSRHATKALAVAASLAREHGGRLQVLHVVAPIHPVAGFPAEAMVMLSEVDIARSLLPQLKTLVERTVKGRGAPRVECKVTVGAPWQRIIEAARGADSVVMGTVGRTGLSHVLIGSVAEKVVRHAPVPVLTVRAAGPARARGSRRAGRPRRQLRAARRG